MDELDRITPWLKCPMCGHGNLRRGVTEFICPACGTGYPLVEGIPDFALHVTPASAAGAVQQRYEQHDVADYKLTMRHWTLPLLGSSVEEMAALVEGVTRGGGCLLEVPVGPGDFNFEVYQRRQRNGDLPGLHIVAVDLTWAMLRHAQRQVIELGLTDLVLIRADVARLPFKGHVFDALLTLNGLHVFPDEPAALENMYAVAKPDAQIAGSCLVAGADGLAGWLMRVFQTARNVPHLTIESMAAQVQAYWPTAKVTCSGAVLTFERV